MKFFRPVGKEFRISSPYGTRKDPITGQESTPHYGIDFAVPVGTPVIAAVKGEVVKAGWQKEDDRKVGFGYYVCQYVREGSKSYQIYYGHLSEINVKVGQQIEAGYKIGLSGNTGKSSGPHLHFECRPVGQKGIPVEFEETI